MQIWNKKPKKVNLTNDDLGASISDNETDSNSDNETDNESDNGESND